MTPLRRRFGAIEDTSNTFSARFPPPSSSSSSSFLLLVNLLFLLLSLHPRRILRFHLPLFSLLFATSTSVIPFSHRKRIVLIIYDNDLIINERIGNAAIFVRPTITVFWSKQFIVAAKNCSSFSFCLTTRVVDALRHRFFHWHFSAAFNYF